MAYALIDLDQSRVQVIADVQVGVMSRQRVGSRYSLNGTDISARCRYFGTVRRVSHGSDP